MVELILLRHGETDWNKLGKMQGISDVPLNNTGTNQAIKYGQNIKRDINSIITSPLKRALQSAELINEYLKVDVRIDKRITERDYGKYTGRNILEITPLEYLNTSGIENELELENRVKDFLKSIEKLEGLYLVVCHGVIILKILSHITNIQYRWDQNPIDNCSEINIVYRDSWNISS